MEAHFIQNLLIVLSLGLAGGYFAKLIKLPTISGYIVAGLIGSIIFKSDITSIQHLAEVGLLLLLFSVGLELSLSKLIHVGYIAIIGAVFQMLFVGLISYLFLLLLGISSVMAIVLACGFSLSSTALVVKTLEDRAETESIHGEVMIGWLLTQDLAVIPIMALLPALTAQTAILSVAGLSILKSAFLLSTAFFIGKMFAPFFIHLIAASNKRELLVLGSVILALGTALIVSLVGISPSLGAFLAGVVLSETQENHAIFSETRSLRDLFVIIFFVTLGYFVSPQVLLHDFPLIIFLVVLNIILKISVIYIILKLFKYKGKILYSVSFGLAQIGEFSFIIYLQSASLGILDQRMASVGIASALITLISAPYIYRMAIPFWRKYSRKLSSKLIHQTPSTEYKNHVIICGYGRMGRWIGEALDRAQIPFIIVDYNHKVVHKARLKGIPVIYGDPAEPDIIHAAGVATARAIIVAIPDSVTQQEVITHCQTEHPNLPVYARAHLNEDVAKISQLQVKKVVQPEFEGAVSIVKEILKSSGKSKPEIRDRLANLRRLHTLKI